MYKHEGPVRRNLSAAALALFYARRGLGWKTGDPEQDARRRAARAALRTLLASAPPPFGALSGPLRGPRPATPPSERHRRCGATTPADDRARIFRERDRLPRDRQQAGTAFAAPSATGQSAPWSLSTARNVVPDEELRRQVATDAIPDAVSIDDAIGATLIDDRYFAEMPGIRGRLLRRVPR